MDSQRVPEATRRGEGIILRQLSAKESPCQCRGHKPGRSIPHAMEQLSPCTTTPEPVLQSPHITITEACELRAHATKEATIMRTPHTAAREQPPFTTTREKPTRSNKNPAQPKTKKRERSQVISLPLLQYQSSLDCSYVSQYCPGKILTSNS